MKQQNFAFLDKIKLLYKSSGSRGRKTVIVTVVAFFLILAIVLTVYQVMRFQENRGRAQVVGVVEAESGTRTGNILVGTSTETSSGQYIEFGAISQLTPTSVPSLTPTRIPSPTPTRVPSPTPTQIPTVIPTTVPSSTNGLKGDYYTGTNFNTFIFSRIDNTVNFNWGLNSPASNVPSDQFSVRWTGFVQPRYSQIYTFYVNSDDGVRLWVNNQLIIDQWYDHSAQEFSGKILLSKNKKYSIKLEYYENNAFSNAILSWSSQSQKKQVIPQGRLFTPNVLGVAYAQTTCQYTIPAGSPTVTTSVNLSQSGNYTVWSRVMHASAQANSWYLQIDNNCPINVADSTDLLYNSWGWLDYQNDDMNNKIKMDLTSGNHVVRLIGREPGTKLDKVIFVLGDCVPQGMEGTCPVQATVTPTQVPVVPTNTPTPVPPSGSCTPVPSDATTSTIQNLINSNAGKTLCFPAGGNYTITATLTVPHGMVITGSNSTLTKSQNGSLFELKANNITIDGLRLIGPGPLAYVGDAISSDNSTSLTGIVIKNNYIQGWSNGIWLYKERGVEIRNNEIREINYTGISLPDVVGTFIGAGKPSLADLKSGNDLTSRFSVVVDNNKIYDVHANAYSEREGYGITVSHAGVQPARVLISNNRIDYVPQWECIDSHAGREMYVVRNSCYMATRQINIAGDSRYNVQMTDNYVVGNTIIKGPEGPVPSGIGLAGDRFPKPGYYNTYNTLESIVVYDSANNSATGAVVDNKLFGYGFTGWAGIYVQDAVTVSGNICYPDATGQSTANGKSCE